MNPSTAFGPVLADELARCGLREVVVAPGLQVGRRSRWHSTSSTRRDGCGCTSASTSAPRRSPRSAGQGVRRPVAVLCTSGTAAANFHPAVIEADESADPVARAHRGPAAGTARHRRQPDGRPGQAVRLGGPLVRRVGRAGTPPRHGRLLALAGLPRLGARGRRAWPLPGPVHLNLPFRDPLVPDPQPRTPGSLRTMTGRTRWTGGPMGRRGPGSPAAARPPRRLSCPGRSGGWWCAVTATTTRPRSSNWPSGPVAGPRRAVIRRAARAGRADRLPVPARLAPVHGGAPARGHRLGRAPRADPAAVRAARLPWRARARDAGPSGTSSSPPGPGCGPTRSAPRPTSRRRSG